MSKSFLQSNGALVLGALCVAAAVAIPLWMKSRNKKKRKVCVKPKGSVKIAAIYIFPIKSCKGIKVDSWKVGRFGFENDRRWMIVNPETNRFITQRQKPKMVLISPSFQDDHLCLNAPGMPTLKIPMSEKLRTKAPIIDVGVWGDTCKGIEESAQASEWISKFLETDAKLVRLPDDNARLVEEKYRQKDLENLVSYADAYPVNLASNESMAEVNSKITGKVLPITRFRPNIVVEAEDGGVPFMEDTWSRIKVGEVYFKMTRMCTRCKLTTVDPDKGEFDGEEPLQALRTFRKGLLEGKDELCFGHHMLPEKLGIVSVGQVVDILE